MKITVPASDRELRQRFAAHYTVGEPEACWEWDGPVLNSGYGYLRHDGVTHTAQRLAWAIHYGMALIPVAAAPSAQVCHTCHHKLCVNPRHLYMGTRYTNLADARAAGRVLRGEQVGTSVLVEAQVQALRALRHRWGVSYRALGAQFGVSPATASRVCKGETWAHVIPLGTARQMSSQWDIR